MSDFFDNLPDNSSQDPWPPPGSKLCGRCYEIVDELFEPKCNERPEKLLGAPLGMYHCPDCGAMVVAGIEHPQLCKACCEGNHPAFDPPREGQ